MNKNTTDYFIRQIDEERFVKNRDLLMKAVEKDLKLIAWMLWGLDLLFEDLSLQEMSDFIGPSTQEDLKKYIEPTDIRIVSEESIGVILDNNYRILKAGKPTGLFNLENEVSLYSFAEKEARSFYYSCALIFWEKGNIRGVDKEHYRRIVPPTCLWIFPESSGRLKNSVRILPFSFGDEATIVSADASEPAVQEKPAFEFKSSVYFCYLGDPSEILKEIEEDPGKVSKLKYLLLLNDLIFSFTLDKEKRLELLKQIFNLDIEEEVNVMDAALQGIMEFFLHKGREEGREEGINESITNLATHLVKKSGNTLSIEKALEEARAILDPKPVTE